MRSLGDKVAYNDYKTDIKKLKIMNAIKILINLLDERTSIYEKIEYPNSIPV